MLKKIKLALSFAHKFLGLTLVPQSGPKATRLTLDPSARNTLIALGITRFAWACTEMTLVIPAEHLEKEWAGFSILSIVSCK